MFQDGAYRWHCHPTANTSSHHDLMKIGSACMRFHTAVGTAHRAIEPGRAGSNRPIASTTLIETRDVYFNDDWQVVEERVDGAAAAERQFVWGPNYVDELVLRDRDADANSGNGLEERLYAVHDGLYSVTALVNSAGAVQERFAYTAYGESTVLDANFATDADARARTHCFLHPVCHPAAATRRW